MEPACCCQLSNSRPASGCHPDRPSRVSQQHTLLLFMFLEDVSAGRGRVSCPNARWRQQMEQIQEVRGTLSRLIHSHQRKFRQAVHSALDKLICNYGTHLKVRVMATASAWVCFRPPSHSADCHFVAHSLPYGRRCSVQYCKTQYEQSAPEEVLYHSEREPLLDVLLWLSLRL